MYSMQGNILVPNKNLTFCFLENVLCGEFVFDLKTFDRFYLTFFY